MRIKRYWRRWWTCWAAPFYVLFLPLWLLFVCVVIFNSGAKYALLWEIPERGIFISRQNL